MGQTMTKRGEKAGIWAMVGIFGCLMVTATAEAADQGRRGDVRGFTVGLTTNELPETGYLGFACGKNGEPAEPEISGWQAYAECPVDENGFHEVAFRYDDSEVLFDDLEGTAVAGHPVVISLLIDDAGTVAALRVLTDPQARPYNKRRARVLSRKVKARFGMEGWECTNFPAEGSESEVGGVFTKERCRKDLGNRTIDLFTRFYRVFDDGEEIINSTRFEVRRIEDGS
jgi:hypothetical protein